MCKTGRAPDFRSLPRRQQDEAKYSGSGCRQDSRSEGAIKQKVGHVTNNPDMEGEGTGEKLAGKVQKKIGQVEKVFEKP